MQDAKNRQKFEICAPSHKFVGLYLHNYGTLSTIGKLLNSNISSTCPYNMVNFGLLAAGIISLLWGTPGTFNGFRVLAELLHGTLVKAKFEANSYQIPLHSWFGSSSELASVMELGFNGRQRNFAVLNRGRHLYLAGRPSPGIGPHSSCHWSIASSNALCRHWAHVSTNRRGNSSTSWTDICVTRRCITPRIYYNAVDLGQGCWLAACQDWWMGCQSHGTKKFDCVTSAVHCCIVLLEDVPSNAADHCR